MLIITDTAGKALLKVLNSDEASGRKLVVHYRGHG